VEVAAAGLVVSVAAEPLSLEQAAESVATTVAAIQSLTVCAPERIGFLSNLSAPRERGHSRHVTVM
jgi:hypothetical protein